MKVVNEDFQAWIYMLKRGPPLEAASRFAETKRFASMEGPLEFCGRI